MDCLLEGNQRSVKRLRYGLLRGSAGGYRYCLPQRRLRSVPGRQKFGRNAHPAQPVAEGIPGDQIGGIVERIVAEYKEKGHPNERFHKFSNALELFKASVMWMRQSLLK